MNDESDKSSEKLSLLAQRIKLLREAVFKASGARARLPQPLFWSLFNAEVSEIKRQKSKSRLFAALLNPEDPLTK